MRRQRPQQIAARGLRIVPLTRAVAAVVLAMPWPALAQVVVDGPRSSTVNLDSEPGSNAATAEITAAATVNTANGEALVGQNFRWTVDSAGQLISNDANTFSVRLQNGESFTNRAAGRVQGIGGGLTAINAAATVVNEGRIVATNGPGIELRAGGFLLNAAGAEVRGGSYGVRLINSSNGLVNAGLIQASSGEGLHLEGGSGEVVNAGTASVLGTTYGVNLVNGSVTLTNAGNVQASAGVGVATNSGGTVNNQSGAAIRGATTGVSMTNGTAAINNTGLIQGGDWSLRFETGNGMLTQDSGALLIGAAYGAGSSHIVLHGQGVAGNDFLQFATLNVDAQRWSLLGRTEATATTVSGGQLWLGAPGVDTAVLVGNTVDVASGTVLAAFDSRIEAAVSNEGTLAVGAGLPTWSPSIGRLDIAGSLDNRGTLALTDGQRFGNVLQVSGDYHGLGRLQLGASVNLANQGPLASQRADRLLVRGDASGVTVVTISATSTGIAAAAAAPLRGPDGGVSLIQVSGQSTATTFLPSRAYVTGGSPYRYRLYAYGPGAANGAASPAQNLVGNPEAYWDYRLQRGFETAIPVPPGDIDLPGGGDGGSGGGGGGGGGTGGGGSGGGPGGGGTGGGGTGGGGTGTGSGGGASGGEGDDDGRYELAPQVPGYLAMLNGVMSTGWDDLDNLHRRLGEIRRSDDAEDATQGSEAFVRVHGGRARYAPHLSFAEYGYSLEQDYQAVQLGGTAVVPSSGRGIWRIGAALTLGRAEQTPELRDAAAELRTDTRTWSLLGTWMDATGAYVDLQVGYGAIKGRKRALVERDLEGGQVMEVARPRGSRWLVSVETGWPFRVGDSRWGLEPQLQLAWQQVEVDPFSDSEGLHVAGRRESAGLGRLGVRLFRGGTAGLSAGDWRPWLRLDYLHGLEEGGQLEVGGVIFRTDRYGQAWRAGLGMDARLGARWDMYAEGYWQGRIHGEGWEAWNAVLGVRARW